MNKFKKILIICALGLAVCTNVYGAKLAIVIDDFGYRLHNEKKVISLSPEITIAVLPNSPNAAKMANFAHDNGNDVILHLPMAPFGQQALEINTLAPSMSQEEIDKIIGDAVGKVPHVIGMNNHMGSLMTSNLPAMQRVMNSLSNYALFFLDSKTIGKTQGVLAAEHHRIPYAVRDVFLDDSQKKEDVLRQFNLAISVARKHGFAIAIGHPYDSTVAMLTEQLKVLPEDIELVKVKSLLNYPAPLKLGELVNEYESWFNGRMFEHKILVESNTLQ